jgi:small subunit ribosomal protein S27Ae
VSEPKKIHEQYEIKDGKLERKRPFCNRCGRGYFMADHGDRYTCGHCGFTKFKQKERE